MDQVALVSEIFEAVRDIEANLLEDHPAHRLVPEMGESGIAAVDRYPQLHRKRLFEGSRVEAGHVGRVRESDRAFQLRKHVRTVEDLLAQGSE